MVFLRIIEIGHFSSQWTKEFLCLTTFTYIFYALTSDFLHWRGGAGVLLNEFSGLVKTLIS